MLGRYAAKPSKLTKACTLTEITQVLAKTQVSLKNSNFVRFEHSCSFLSRVLPKKKIQTLNRTVESSLISSNGGNRFNFSLLSRIFPSITKFRQKNESLSESKSCDDHHLIAILTNPKTKGILKNRGLVNSLQKRQFWSSEFT